MIGFVAAYDVLWFILRGVMNIAFDPDARSDFSQNDTAHPASF